MRTLITILSIFALASCNGGSGRNTTGSGERVTPLELVGDIGLEPTTPAV